MASVILVLYKDVVCYAKWIETAECWVLVTRDPAEIKKLVYSSSQLSDRDGEIHDIPEIFLNRAYFTLAKKYLFAYNTIKKVYCLEEIYDSTH